LCLVFKTPICQYEQEIQALKEAAELAQQQLYAARSLAENLKQQQVVSTIPYQTFALCGLRLCMLCMSTDMMVKFLGCLLPD
jgi:hypothetical protein